MTKPTAPSVERPRIARPGIPREYGVSKATEFVEWSRVEDRLTQMSVASNAKFPEYGVTADIYKARGAIAIRPRKVIAWTDFTKNPTRFRFDS